MKIYTKTGDKGETGLFGGERVSKNSPRIEAYGTVDELNSFIGLAINDVKSERIIKVLEILQNLLFNLGADLATPETEKNKKLNISRIPEEYSLQCEKWIDSFESEMPPIREFILPGGSRGASLLNICRTVSRRAERNIIHLSNLEQINPNISIFVNRLSDLFFVLARYENFTQNREDVKWNKNIDFGGEIGFDGVKES